MVLKDTQKEFVTNDNPKNELLKCFEYSFKYNESKNFALKNINFKIEHPEIILLAGDSGSGKSSFLKSFNGLIPDLVEGEICGERFLQGKNFCNLKIYEIAKITGNVFQNPRTQFFTSSCKGEILFPLENFGVKKSEMEMRLNELVKIFQLQNLLAKDIYSISGGERQRLAIATALALKPKLLFFDEPSANLDYGNAMQLKKLISSLKEKGIAIIIAEHRFFYLSGLVDKVFLLQDGELTIFNSEQEFRNSTYDARSFDLFSLDLENVKLNENFPPKENILKGEKVIELKNIFFKNILHNISCDFFVGEVACIVGINGAGKTTLAKILTQSLKPTRGDLFTKDIPFLCLQDADYQLFGSSVKDELKLGNKKIPDEKIDLVLQDLHLLDKKNAHPFDLSGGQKQRLQFAMAILSSAHAVIFDEPTSGLDVRSMKAVSKKIYELQKTKAVIIISHDYEFILRTANRIIFLHEGQIAKDFPLNNKTLHELKNIFHTMEESV